MRLEGVTDPNRNFAIRRKGQQLRVEHFSTTGRQCVRFVVAEVGEEPGMGELARVFRVDAVYVGPDDEFIGIDDLGDEGAGKIGTVAPERGDAAVRCGSDE